MEYNIRNIFFKDHAGNEKGIPDRLFRERRAIARARAHAHIEMSRQTTNCPPNKQQIARLDCLFFTSLTEKRKI